MTDPFRLEPLETTDPGTAGPQWSTYPTPAPPRSPLPLATTPRHTAEGAGAAIATALGLVVLMTLGLVAVSGLSLLSDHTSDPMEVGPVQESYAADTQEYSQTSHEVELRVTSKHTYMVTFSSDTTDPVSVTGTGSWKVRQTIPGGTWVRLSAANEEQAGYGFPITCQVLVDGKVVMSTSVVTSAANPAVACDVLTEP